VKRGEDKILVRTEASAEESGIQEYPMGGEPRDESGDDDLHDRFLRLRAEFENFRQRSSRELAEEGGRAARALMTKLLPLLDALEGALQAPAAGEAAAYRDGFAQIHNQLIGLLESEGVEEVPGVGSPFDPELHDAVGETKSTDVASGRIAEVVRSGYIMNGHLLRPALVLVAGPGTSSRTEI
jgi:molecular chaperone GrpE